MLDAKEYLSQVKRMKKVIQHLKDNLSYHREAAPSIRTSRFNPNGKVQSNPMHNSMEDHILNAYDLEMKIAEKQLELEQLKHVIMNQIHDLDNYRYIEVLYYCYILNIKQDSTAKEMGCSIDYVKELKKNAVKEFEAVHGTEFEPIVTG